MKRRLNSRTLPTGRGNEGNLYTYIPESHFFMSGVKEPCHRSDRLTRESSATKDLGAMVRSESGVSQQCARAESRPTASSAAVKRALPVGQESQLSTWACMRPRLQHRIWFGTPQCKKCVSKLGWAQQRGTRLGSRCWRSCPVRGWEAVLSCGLDHACRTR